MKSLLLVAAFAVLAWANLARAKSEFLNAVQPQMAVGHDGRVWLVYAQSATAPAAQHGDHSAHAAGHGDKSEGSKGKKRGHGPQGGAGDVFVACSTDGGATFSAAVKVAHVPALMTGNRRGPRIAANGDRVTVTAIAHELVAFTSDDGGKTWSQPVTINDVPNSAHEGLHDLAGSHDGQLFVTWLDLRNEKAELWGASSQDGGRTWSADALIYKSPDKSICECCHPDALFDAEGNLAVMWRNSIEGSRDMWISTRSKGSAKFTMARKLGEGTWKINGCPHDGGTLVALGGGNFGAVWQRAGEIFITAADGKEMKLGSGRQPVAAVAHDRTMVIWNDGGGLVVLRDAHKRAPEKHAAEARFPIVVSLADGKGSVLAYERGARGASSVTVERL